jgi:hypothetical protein
VRADLEAPYNVSRASARLLADLCACTPPHTKSDRMRGGVSLVQQVFSPRAEVFPLHEGFFCLQRSLHSTSGNGWAAARALQVASLEFGLVVPPWRLRDVLRGEGGVTSAVGMSPSLAYRSLPYLVYTLQFASAE